MQHLPPGFILIAALLLTGGLSACATPSATSQATHTGAPAPGTQRDIIDYHINKLADRSNIRYYGDSDNPRPWYIAAEALGDIGKAAVPALIERLETSDSYELKLALYALMLASQDPALVSETEGDYLQLGTVLEEASNEENRQRAMAWWEKYRSLW